MAFSRLLATVLLANVLTLTVSNLFRLPVWSTALVYPVCLGLGWLLVRAGRLRRPRTAASGAMVAAVLVVAAILAAVRLPYVLEWIPGNTVHVIMDDHARLAELVSMTLSPRYPLAAPVSGKFLFSFYYAALYPMAFAKIVVPVLTLKDVIFAGCAVYCVVILLSLLEISTLLLPSPRAVWLTLYFVLAFSGLDWAMDIFVNGAPVLAHHEWWQKGPPFHVAAQITAFPTALLFAVHHVAAAVSCLLAGVFWWRAGFGHRWAKLVVVGLLLVNAFYSSVFVALGCLPFVMVEWRGLVKRYLKSPVLPLLLAIWGVPLFLFLHKLPGQRFVVASSRLGLAPNLWADKLLSLPAWLVLVPVVELAGLPLFLAAAWRDLALGEKRYFVASVAFLASTYVVAFTGNNNYSMRGMLVPTIVMIYLAARHHGRLLHGLRRFGRWAPVLLVAGAAVFAFGNVLELAGHARRSVLSMKITWRLAKGPAVATERFPIDYRGIARDRRVRFYTPRAGESSYRYFNAEKRVEIPLARMDRWERELLRYPLRARIYRWAGTVEAVGPGFANRRFGTRVLGGAGRLPGCGAGGTNRW